MKYYSFDVLLQEVPGEISLCFSITGCSLRCEGCHSSFLWKERGEELTEAVFLEKLNKYEGFASCVLFMGGEWHPETLVERLKQAREKGYSTCLYTGQEDVGQEIKSQLTWIKTGRWIAEKGGLDSPTTNQEFTEVATKKKLNHLFIKNETHDPAYR